jgi:hypothetical protein
MGRVRSWRKSGTSGTFLKEPRLRKPVPTVYGYMTLMFLIDKKRVLRYVHHLVLEAFVGPCPPGQETRHLDGNKENNALSNLVWGTHSENVGDQIRHGTDTRGERNGQAKLTREIAESIRASGEQGKDLAKRYGVSQATICRTRKGLRYAA